VSAVGKYGTVQLTQTIDGPPPMPTIRNRALPPRKPKDRLDAAMHRAAVEKRPIILKHRGKEMAAVVPIEYVHALRGLQVSVADLENLEDTADADAAYRDHVKNPGRSFTLDDALAKYRLTRADLKR
jgi:hypothetical protein